MLNEKARLLQIMNELIADHQKLAKSHEALSADVAKLSTLFETFYKQVEKASVSAQRSKSAPQLRSPLQEMQEMNRSFNMQYLLLQQKIQQETREYNLLSNIMKTRHDSAKNAINNIR